MKLTLILKGYLMTNCISCRC